MELDHGLQDNWGGSVSVMGENSSALVGWMGSVFPPNAEYFHPHKGPLLLSEWWLFAPLDENWPTAKTGPKVKQAPEPHESLGTKECPL